MLQVYAKGKTDLTERIVRKDLDLSVWNGRKGPCVGLRALSALTLVIAISAALFALSGCSSTGSTSGDGPTTAEEVANQYHYDSNGHIYKE